ncbi:hypothetical protein [Glycomyces sp. NPDC021274]|uniref:hypothetical protein n=1 Tax=Glycomyces sp. NPDC021274 TaxID=3155120 RepID=UPI00340B0D12
MTDALWGATRFAAVLGVFWLLVTFGPEPVTDTWHNDSGGRFLMLVVALFAAFAAAVVGNRKA